MVDVPADDADVDFEIGPCRDGLPGGNDDQEHPWETVSGSAHLTSLLRRADNRQLGLTRGKCLDGISCGFLYQGLHADWDLPSSFGLRSPKDLVGVAVNRPDRNATWST